VSDEPQVEARPLAAISDGIVRLHSEYYGRGPMRAKTYQVDNIVLCVMEDSLTTVERTLASLGREAEVCSLRHAFRSAMRERFEAVVEETTGRHVIAFMSQVSIDPDLSVECFVLEPATEA
jgi:uncharacterized protein YbcI